MKPQVQMVEPWCRDWNWGRQKMTSRPWNPMEFAWLDFYIWGCSGSFLNPFSLSLNQSVYVCLTFIFGEHVTCFFGFTGPHGEELCFRIGYTKSHSYLHWWFRWWPLELLNWWDISEVLDWFMLSGVENLGDLRMEWMFSVYGTDVNLWRSDHRMWWAE